MDEMHKLLYFPNKILTVEKIEKIAHVIIGFLYNIGKKRGRKRRSSIGGRLMATR